MDQEQITQIASRYNGQIKEIGLSPITNLQAKNTGKKHKEKNEKNKIEHNQTKAKATNPEQNVGWTWTDLEGKMAGHMTR